VRSRSACTAKIVKKLVKWTRRFTLILLLAFFTEKGKENVKHAES
jgi:hypothetical protein